MRDGAGESESSSSSSIENFITRPGAFGGCGATAFSAISSGAFAGEGSDGSAGVGKGDG